MAPSSSAASSTLFAIRPTWSSDHEIGMMPCRLTRPYVGLRPTTPHTLAGRRTDPEVSPPVAPSNRPAATAAADPPLDPPGSRSRFQGLRVPGVAPPND